VSLTALVVDAVKRLGQATIEDLLPIAPQFSREQVHNALCNARDRKLIRSTVRGNAKAKRLSVWVLVLDAPPKPAKKLDRRYSSRPPASVWDLGAEMPRMQWPPIAVGQRFELLGGWTE
jgi:hypothetical protein